jgi:ketosteroid isomerase-like protein
MTRDELKDRILQLFPPLGDVEPWEWATTDEDEPVVVIERHASFTGLADGGVDLTAPIPNKANQYRLVGLPTSRSSPRRPSTRSSTRASRPTRDTARSMSQQNVEIARDAFVAFNRGDLDAFLDEYWADDIDYRAVEGAPDDHGPIHGKAAMRAHWQDWLDTFDDLKIEPLELIDAGEDVVAVLRFGGRAKLSGVETDLTFAVVYTLRDGRVARGREYWTRDEALEAAGLRE